ncbi:fumarylacetoacetate hydrolase family protein [Streptomyces phaeolivaceus]|nr:fumarylacetoacetate hydrolase family protein [Streptomyces phaeolivaceus]
MSIRSLGYLGIGSPDQITEHLTLEPGDVVSTGTPAGVGLGTGR